MMRGSVFWLALSASIMASTGQGYAQSVARKPTAAFDFVGANPTPLCIYDKGTPPTCVPIGSIDSTTHLFSSTPSSIATTGDGTIGGTLGVTGAATLSSTLGVAGAMTLSGAAEIEGGVAVPAAVTGGLKGAGTINAQQYYMNDVQMGSVSGTIWTLGGTSNFWTDTTSIAGNPFKYYTDINSVATDATLAKFNRIFCGSTTATSGGYPASPVLWTSALWNNWDAAGQLSCINALGNGAANLASRTSDYRAASGQASPGSAGFNALGFNDDTGSGAPIALGGLALGVRNSAGVLGTTLGMQFDVVNWGNVVDATPYDAGGGTGRTVDILLTPGAREIAGKTRSNATAGIQFNGHNGIEFRKGIVVNAAALDATLGTAGKGLFIEMAPLQEFAWRDSGGSLVAELWGDVGNGLTVYPKLTVSGNFGASGVINGGVLQGNSAAPTISGCGTSPSVSALSNSSAGSFTTGTGSPTSCTMAFAASFTNAAYCIVTARNAAAAGVSLYVSGGANAFQVTFGAGVSSASFNYVCIGDA